MSSLNLLNGTELDDAFISNLYVDNIQVNDQSIISINSDVNFNNNIEISGINLDQHIKNQITATGALTYNNLSGEIHGITIDNYNRSVALSLTGTTVLSADLVSGTGQALVLYMNYSQTVGSNKALSITPTNTSQTILSTSIPGNTTQLLSTFEILQSTLNQTFVPSGIFDINVFTAEDSANDGLLLYADVIIYNGSTETIIATTDQIEITSAYPAVSETTISAVNTTQRAFTTGYSLRIKLYGINNRGSTHTLYTYYEGSGATYSHLHTPFNSTLIANYTALSPLSINSSNVISISEASGTTNGYLSSSNFNFFNSKQNQLGATTPLQLSGTTLSILQASSTQSGFLSSTDWSTFNSTSSQWTTSGADIYRASGNIIMGGTTGTERLTVYGNEDVGDVVNGNYLRLSGTNPNVAPFISNTLISFFSKGVPPISNAYVDARIFSSGGSNTATHQGTLVSRAKQIEFRDDTGGTKLTTNITGTTMFGSPNTVSLSVGPTIAIAGALTGTSSATFTGNLEANNYKAEHWTGNTTNVPAGSTYFKLATLPTTTDTGNGGAVRIQGTIGGWNRDRIGTIDVHIISRGGIAIGGSLFTGQVSALSNITTYADIIIYQETSNTFTIYLHSKGSYASYDFIVSCTSGINNMAVFGPSTAITPTGSINTASVLGAIPYTGIGGNFDIDGQYSINGNVFNALAPLSYSTANNRISIPNVDTSGTDGYISSAQYLALATAAQYWSIDNPNKNLLPTGNAYNVFVYNTDISGSPSPSDCGFQWRRTTLSGALNHYLKMRLGGAKDGYLIHSGDSSVPIQLFSGSQQPALLIGGSTTDTIDANTCVQIKQSQTATPTLLKIENGGASNVNSISRIWLKDATASYSIQSGGNQNELDIVNTATSTQLMTIAPTTMTHFGTKAFVASNSNRSIECFADTSNNAGIDFHSRDASVQDFDGRILCSGGSTTSGQGTMNYLGASHNFNTTVNITGQMNCTNTASVINQLSLTRNSVDGNSAVFNFYKTRNSATTNNNDYLGGISAYGKNTSNADSRATYWDAQQSAAAGTTVSGRMMFGVRNLAGTEEEIMRLENGKAMFRTTNTALDGNFIAQKSSSGGTHALSLYNDNTTSTLSKYTGFNTYNRQVSTDYETGSFKVYPTDNGINNAKINLDLRLNSSIQTFMELNSLGQSLLYGSNSSTARYEMARWFGGTTILNYAGGGWATSSVYINGNTSAGENGMRFHPNSNGNMYLDYKGTGSTFWRGDNSAGATQRGEMRWSDGTFRWGNTTPLTMLNDGQFSISNISGSATDPLIRRNPTNGILTVDTSDRRIKKNFRLQSNDFWKKKLLQLKPQMFDLHPMVNNGKKDVIGFIAQDLEAFDPNLVAKVPYMINKCEHCQTHCVNDKDGKCECPDKCECLEIHNALTVNQIGLLPYLAGALKAIIEENEQLKTDLVKERTQYKLEKDKLNKKIEKQEIKINNIITALNNKGIFIAKG